MVVEEAEVMKEAIIPDQQKEEERSLLVVIVMMIVIDEYKKQMYILFVDYFYVHICTSEFFCRW